MKKKEAKVAVYLRLSEPDFRALEELASAEELSVSAFMVVMAKAYINTHKESV